MTDGGPGLSGYLVIDKPAGWTSFDVVARARRLLGERKIGHAGTLDPAATGVLPLAVGAATKTLEYLSGASKSYLAEMTFGVQTDTLDVEGRVTRISPVTHLTTEMIANALTALRGPGFQIPPMFAAIKVNGERLYERARRGETIERAPRPVTFFELDLLDWQPPVATVWVDCSKGTYIRTLASDLGEALETGAFLSNLVRYRTGPFWLCEALTMDELAVAELPEAWPDISIHPDAVIWDKPALLLSEAESLAWRQGKRYPARDGAVGDCRAYSFHGEWLGIGRAADGGATWQPVKVIGSAA